MLGDKVIKTDVGEQITITLPGGSNVNLNSNSSLIFAKKWKKEELRKVVLIGEAYFEVNNSSVAQQPFLVETSSILVEVSGTKFNVNAHPEISEIFVEEGSIRLRTSTDSVVLNHCELAVVTGNSIMAESSQGIKQNLFLG